MTDEELKQEFNRWIDVGKPEIWYKDSKHEWVTVLVPNWRNKDAYFIVDDEQAELRKFQIDNPNTKFQAYYNNKWTDTTPSWFIDRKYRVKPLEWYEDPNMIGKPVWVRDSVNSYWVIDVFMSYTNDAEYLFECGRGGWKEAKPVKPEECYQEVKE